MIEFGYFFEAKPGGGMPYSAEHKQRTHERIVEAARILFNRFGFEGVTIDMVMEAAGLTRGGFYNHFASKESLYAEAVSSFLMGRGAEWRAEAGVDPAHPTTGTARRMVDSYLSSEHLGDLDGQCPMIALPSDVARAGPEVQASYAELLRAMVGLFESSLRASGTRSRKRPKQKARALAALCVGGMVLARTLPESELAEEVRAAARATANELLRS